MDTARLAEMMRATLSEDKTERDAAEEQLKQVKQHTHHVLSLKMQKFIHGIQLFKSTKLLPFGSL